jgi:hypothetical protein
MKTCPESAVSLRGDRLVHRLFRASIFQLSCAAMLLVALRVSAADCRKLRFASTNYFSGGAPFSIATGDLNGDGKADFVLPNADVDEFAYFSIFYGNGAGKFTRPTNVTTATYPRYVVVGDFNGDSRSDLAVLHGGSVGVEVWLNNGDGTFAAPVYYLVEASPSKMVTGDFNQDGILDLAVTDYESTKIDVLLGTGSGSFNPPIRSTVATGSGGVAVGDFTEDGIPDLAISDYVTESFSLFRGDGTGHFALANTYGLGGDSGDVATADFNHDGHLDLAVGVYNITPNNHIAVYLGNGDGSFGEGQSVQIDPGSPNGLLAVDLNADGNVDLATAIDLQTVLFFVGEGTGSFRLAKTATVRGLRPQPLALAGADFNGDGRTDVVSADFGNGKATTFVSIPCQR